MRHERRSLYPDAVSSKSPRIFATMTSTHIRELIDAMSDEDRFFASAYLQHLGNESDPQHKATLAARMTRIDEGHKFSLDQLVDVHQQLERQGL